MEQDRQLLEQKSVQLRQELKVWETQFVETAGRKAGREDIKGNSAIAAKYKEYNKLRDHLSSKINSQNPSTTAAKRNAARGFTQSPRKRSRTPEVTPRKPEDSQMKQYEEEVEFATPIVKRTMIGPTPQKDGQILGIFDLLTSETPSKLRVILGDADTNVTRTPSKTAWEIDDGLVEERMRGSRTPASTGKRFLLDSFVTPKKRKDNETNTPSSSLKEFTTPAFLRRDAFALSAVTEDPQSPEMARPWKRRSFGRSLSGMVKELRRQEEQKADEEWDIMQEMEDMDQEVRGKKSPKHSKVVIEDSQVQLDVDGFVPSDIESEAEPKAGKGSNGQPRKAWKKKGLKRQTRRVIMRPVTMAPQQAQEPGICSSDDEDENPDQIVGETQLVTKITASDSISEVEEAESEYDNTDYAEPREKITTEEGKSTFATTKAQSKSKSGDTTKKGKLKQESVATKKAGKKKDPNGPSNANYRRLNIRGSNGAKGKAGGRGRFARKR